MFHYMKRRAKEMENVQLAAHADARTFLHASQINLERHEVEHSLIPDVALALQGAPASPAIATTAMLRLRPSPTTCSNPAGRFPPWSLRGRSRIASRAKALAPGPVLEHWETLRAITAGHSIRSTRLLVGSTSGNSRVRSVRSGRTLSS